jgi:5'-nucleotidase
LAGTYTVAMNNYLQGGGDGFSVLTGATQVVVGPVDNDALVAYLQRQSAPLTPARDGRVTQAP